MATLSTSIFPFDQVGRSEGLPSEVIPDYEKDEEFLKKVHHVLLEVSFQEIIKTFIETTSPFFGMCSKLTNHPHLHDCMLIIKKAQLSFCYSISGVPPILIWKFSKTFFQNYVWNIAYWLIPTENKNIKTVAIYVQCTCRCVV